MTQIHSEKLPKSGCWPLVPDNSSRRIATSDAGRFGSLFRGPSLAQLWAELDRKWPFWPIACPSFANLAELGQVLADFGRPNLAQEVVRIVCRGIFWSSRGSPGVAFRDTGGTASRQPSVKRAGVATIADGMRARRPVGVCARPDGARAQSESCRCGRHAPDRPLLMKYVHPWSAALCWLNIERWPNSAEVGLESSPSRAKFDQLQGRPGRDSPQGWPGTAKCCTPSAPQCWGPNPVRCDQVWLRLGQM